MQTDRIQIDDPTAVADTVRIALAEDIGSGDITGQLIDASKQVTGQILSKDTGILCGSPWAAEVFRQLDAEVFVKWQFGDGEELAPGKTIARLTGPARSIMSGERTALNFLQTLSGTATRVHELVSQVAHTAVTLLDTRKTLPGLRYAQKYAVRIGGGSNHRMGLYDAYLIKENHIRACGGIEPAVSRARHLAPNRPVEVEVQSLEELEQALDARTDTVMLDNFDLQTIEEAVAINAGRSKLEASGGIDQRSLVNIAETGVDYISVGAMTKHCKALDLSLLIE